MNKPTIQATKYTSLGLFLVSGATLIYEILLTRIFSVTTYYHFAFMAISIAMFGMTVGALLVYLFEDIFTEAKTKYFLSLSAWFFSVAIVLSFLTHLSIPLIFQKSIVGFYAIVLNYFVISIPFVFSGMCVCLSLTKFPQDIGKLYGIDLAGAAIGCVTLLLFLQITDGPTAVFLVASVAALGCLCFSLDQDNKKLQRLGGVSFALLLIFSLFHTGLVNKQHSLLRPTWVKGQIEARPPYEKWNSFSRIIVLDNLRGSDDLIGWGTSSTLPKKQKIDQLSLNIDANAGTVMTKFDGDLSAIQHLKYDITCLVHFIRNNSRVLVIGPGGGRDVLSALIFGQAHITAVEINQAILNTVNNIYGDYTGHLDKNPKIEFVNDEARSFIARQKQTFDIIQASLIDTWAATAAGAFVLSEHSLYTIEAWTSFIQHLSPQGILTVSRWYKPILLPKEIYRTLALASATLKKMGIQNPRDHIILARNLTGPEGGLATLLVGRSPFTKGDIHQIEKVCQELKYEIVVSPTSSMDVIFTELANGDNPDTLLAQQNINVSAPTDDNPFFFYMLRLKDLFKIRALRGNVPVFILGVLLVTVLFLTTLCIIGPLLIWGKKMSFKENLPLLIYFSGIGFGFMLIEISQMQRLIIFLGHPTYGPSVVLFSRLVASSCGSLLSQRMTSASLQKKEMILVMSLLLGSLFIFGHLTPLVIREFAGSSNMIRIGLAALCLAIPGLFMGMPFPLGMKMAYPDSAHLTPWLWGVNGATSVCASVIAIAIALSFGISASFWVGVACYLAVFSWSPWLFKK